MILHGMLSSKLSVILDKYQRILRILSKNIFTHSILSCFLIFNALAQVPPSQADVLRVLGQYVSSVLDPIGPTVRAVGYTPPSALGWDTLPAAGKLETAYKAAEAANPGGGNRALAAIAVRLSEKYDSIRNNPQIKTFIGTYYTDSSIEFDSSPRLSMAHTTPAAQDVIITISEYADGKLGGMYRILTNDFGLSRSSAYVILTESNSNSEALLRGYTEIPDVERAGKLEGLVNRAKIRNPALAVDPAIVVFEQSLRPKSVCGVGEVLCSCGGRILGCRSRLACIPGTPCR